MPLTVPRRVPVLLLIVLIAFGAALRAYYFEPALMRTPDERTYTRQADMVLAMGAQGYRILGQELAANPPAVSRYPSPMRVGYITPLMLFMRLTGDASALAGAHLSLIYSLGSLLLLAFLAYRFLSPTVAVVATLFFAVSPFDLTVFRRTWEEAFIALLTLAMLTLAATIARTQGKRQMAALGGFALVGFLALTTKENSGLTFLLCAAGLGMHFLLQRNYRAAMLTAVSAVVAVAGYICALSALFGGVAQAALLVREYAHYSGINPYSMQYDSGPVWLFPAGLFRVSPFLVVAGAVGLIATVSPLIRKRSLAGAGLPAGVALITAAILLLQLATHRYSFRYSAPVFGPMCLLAGIGAAAVLPTLQRLLAPLGRATAWCVLGFAVGVAAYRDLNFAQEKLILPEIQDLALRPILELPPAAVPPDYPK